MNFSERIVRFMRQLEAREFYRLCAVVFGILLICVGLLIYRYYSIAGDLQRKMKALNRQREVTQSILVDYNKVRTQKNKVEDLLEHDEIFKIQQFFGQVIQESGLGSSLKREPVITRHDLVENYREIRLEASLAGLSMQQVVMLLQKVESNERVYVRELHLVATPAHTLDILLHIATFEKAVSVPG